tara:strand:- start:2058 stop:2495 length:438 start_codon:yes stop_codon:yes gene_type:complete
MPNTNYPVIEEWVGKIKEIGDVDYFIGHSIGCQAIIRYLERNDVNVKGIIFIAGWFNLIEECYEDDEEREIARPWIEEEIDVSKVKERCNGILAIFSTNDDCVPLSDSKLFNDLLGAKIVVKENEGHFNQTEKINEIGGFIENGD